MDASPDSQVDPSFAVAADPMIDCDPIGRFLAFAARRPEHPAVDLGHECVS
jgi:hypothetical protein